ncbi:YtxH domain-containing protein [Haloimpatiens sp. FM7330]|uniref:YtxH domain-containing protein n=1 Tax=Haloimpatiens sp. FM7330 TaxID=3298610 RepID=UPI00362688BB
MRRKLMNGVTVGAVMGMAAGILVASNMNRNTRKRIKKTGKRVRNVAEDFYDNMSGYVR